MLRLAAAVMLALLGIGHAVAEGEKSGRFDYYVLALSWSPAWCALEGRSRGAAVCRDGSGIGFMLHGLWPQYERGWPSFCRTAEAPPSRAQTEAMIDLFGSSGLAWHQWDKHGRCSGLSARSYFGLSREAFFRMRRPAVFRRLLKPVRLRAAQVKEAFVKANPAIPAAAVAVSCRRGYVAELRVCLTRDLEPRPCGGDVAGRCGGLQTLQPVP